MKKLWTAINTSDIRNILACISVLGSFIVVVLVILKPIPVGNLSTVNIALGFVLGSLVGGVSGYYFGSSKNNDKSPNP